MPSAAWVAVVKVRLITLMVGEPLVTSRVRATPTPPMVKSWVALVRSSNTMFPIVRFTPLSPTDLAPLMLIPVKFAVLSTPSAMIPPDHMGVLVQLVAPPPPLPAHVPFWAEAEEMARRKQPAKGEKNGDFFGFIVGLLD